MKIKKEDPRAHIALNIIGDIFLRSTTKFSSISKLPKLNQVDQRLKQRSLAAIQSKSPQNKRINVNRISDLGSSPLFQGLDLVPERNQKNSGNQQRHQPLNQQSPLKPQRNLNGAQYHNEIESKEKQQPISSKKPIQRQHNRNPENELSDSRNLGEQKQVKGNIVSQNLQRNQKGIKDDFNIGDKSSDRKRKYSNQNNKSLIQQTKIMTQSRAKSSPKDKKTVSFSPQKHIIQLNPVQKKVNEIKPLPIQKSGNQKKETYVYVPPKRKTKEESLFQLPIQSLPNLPSNNFPSEKKIEYQPINTSIVRKITPKNIQPVIQKTPRPVEKSPIYRPNAIERNSHINTVSQKSIKQTNSNVQSKNTFAQISQMKDQKSRNQSPRKKVVFTEEEMKQDWSKIKQTMRYDSSIIPSKVQRDVSERQDVALKMIAQLFLDASTRYSPGLSMLLRRGISKEEIDQIRSKSLEFNINIFGADRKSPSKNQPKTQRRLNWKDKQSNKKSLKQNQSFIKQEITSAQYKTKKLQEIKQNKKAEQIDTSHSQSRIQTAYKENKKFENNQLINQKNETRNNSQNQTTKIKNQTKTTNNVTSTTNKQNNYVYQPPVKKQQLNQIKNPTLKTKTSIEQIQNPQKSTNKPLTQQKQSSQQLIPSKSTTSILGKKNVVSEDYNIKNSDKNIKKQENQTQINSINPSSIKPFPSVKLENKKPEQPSSQKNINLISSKSQTSLISPSNQAKNINIQQKKTNQTSGYVYQPPNFNKKDNNTATQQLIPVKNQNQSTLRNIKSQKTIKTVETISSNKDIKTPTSKKQQKIKNQNSQSSTIKGKQTKQVNTLTKKTCSLFTLIIKRRLNLNLQLSFSKIIQQSRRNSESSKHGLCLLNTILAFSKNYQANLKRQAFRKIKSTFVTLSNKNSNQKKLSYENCKFLSDRKENIARIIFLIIKNKISTYFEPIKLKSQKVQRKTKLTGRILQILSIIQKGKANKLTKDCFNRVKSCSSFKKTAISQVGSIVRKLNHSALSKNFFTFVTKTILNLKASNAKTINQTLSKSKSQEVISTSRSLILSGQASSIQLSPEDEKKIATKQKQFDRKINDLERKKQGLHQEINLLNKDKRAKNKKNSDLKTKIKEVQKQQLSEGSTNPIQKSTSKHAILSEDDFIPVLTKAYAYLFEDPESKNVLIERFLSDNQPCFQLPTNSALLNEWKIINKNSELKSKIKIYEGEQPRQKQIYQLLKSQNSLITGLLRNFIRQRYIWEWVNIIARQ